MILLKNICKTYKSKYVSVPALRDVNLTFPQKGMVFVVGKSGCGKTTLLNVMGGLDKFDSGELICNGVSTKQYKDKDWDMYRNSYIGFVFQENNLLNEYNVYENVRLAINLQGAKNEAETVLNALKYVGLEGYEKRRINELSGGQKQRITIARAIAKKSKMLLADEPTGSLDEKTGKEIFDLLKKLSQTQLVVIVTHDIASAKLYGDMLIEMSDGYVTEVTELNKTTTDNVCEVEKARTGKLRFGTCLSLATKAYKRTPFRLIILVLLSMFGFSLMTGALKFSLWQPYDLQNQVLQHEEKAIVALTPTTIKVAEGWYRDEERFFDASELDKFKSLYPNVDVVNVGENDESYGGMRMYGQFDDRQRIYFNPSIMGKTCMEEDDLKKFGIELLAGDYPSQDWGEYDVAISEYFFEMYSVLNFNDGDNYGEKEVKINLYEDIIGRKIYSDIYGNRKYTIRAVLNTHFDKEEYAFVKDYALGKSEDYSVDWASAFSSYSQKGFHNLLFMSPKYKLNTKTLYVAIPYNEAAFAKDDFVKGVFDNEEYYFCGYYSRILIYQASQSGRFGNIMVVIACVAITFAVVLFANFISVSIVDKMRQIGILRALGVTKGSVAAIFILQNVIIAAFVFILSSITVQYGIMPLLLIMGTTYTFPFPWYTMKAVDFVILFGFVVATAVLASVLPLVKLAKKSPCEIISASTNIK